MDIQWTGIQHSNRIRFSISDLIRNQHGYQKSGSLLISKVLVEDTREYVCNVTISPTSSSLELVENFIHTTSHELLLGIVIINAPLIRI